MMGLPSLVTLFSCGLGVVIGSLDSLGSLDTLGEEVSGAGKISSFTTTCSSTSSCESSTLSDDIINCMGYLSCKEASVTTSSYSNIAGAYAGYGATIQVSDDTGSTLCEGRCSCWYSTVGGSSGNGNAYCRGSAACAFSTVTSNNGYVTCDSRYSCTRSDVTGNITACYAMYSCFYANIIGKNELYINGELSAAYADITNTPNIYDSGKYGLFNATISSQDLTNNKLIIESNGYYSTLYTSIYCYSGDTCIIKCLGDESCYGSKLYCENGATCKTQCSNCADCPTIVRVDSFDDMDMESLQQEKQFELPNGIDIDIDDINNNIVDLQLDLDVFEQEEAKEKKLFNQAILSSNNNTTTTNNNNIFNTCLVIVAAIIVIYHIIKNVIFVCLWNNNNNNNNNNNKQKQFAYQSI